MHSYWLVNYICSYDTSLVLSKISLAQIVTSLETFVLCWLVSAVNVSLFVSLINRNRTQWVVNELAYNYAISVKCGERSSIICFSNAHLNYSTRVFFIFYFFLWSNWWLFLISSWIFTTKEDFDYIIIREIKYNFCFRGMFWR